MKNYNIQLDELREVYGKISPFEFKNKLIALASTDRKKSTRSLLDAGRGNPNWTAKLPRQAFFTFGQFAVTETERLIDDSSLAGMPKKEGIYQRFLDFVSSNSNIKNIKLLEDIINFCIKKFNFNEDEFVFELADGIIGDNYPYPDRMLIHTERIVHEFLVNEMCYSERDCGKFKLFAVEGATAAMCYIFDSLFDNYLLNKNDKIAIMTPIFTPYLEIPLLPKYELEIVKISADSMDSLGNRTWQYPDSELEKLKDPSLKALFLVNPSNPPSVAISSSCRKKITDIITKYNKDLMIICDDVYATFVNGFKSLMADLPFNTIGVYSMSKYFGVTGWRLGVLGLHEENVFDKKLRDLPYEFLKLLDMRYADLTPEPSKLPFIDRIVADSRQVALNHTAGLSTPQQVQMAFFAAFALADHKDTYKNKTINICKHRKELLYKALEIEYKEDIYDASYYTEIDILDWSKNAYSPQFRDYLKSNYKILDILYKLAKESSIVLLSGGGFSGPEWSIRVSLANLDDDAYTCIGKTLKNILNDIFDSYKKDTLNKE